MLCTEYMIQENLRNMLSMQMKQVDENKMTNSYAIDFINNKIINEWRW